MIKLKDLRKSKRLTQSQVAEVINTTQTCYNYYELEKREPSIETLCKLADFYGVTLDYLVGRKFVYDLGYLDDEQRKLVELIKTLDNNQLSKVIAYVEGLKDK
jgi:transcriptional regulator with XRE-family HTH domain